jgi:hypothetical protein
MQTSKPRMHGLDHRPGGADPIPGLGEGGGALEWEDVGASVVAPTAFFAADGPWFFQLPAVNTYYYMTFSRVRASGIGSGSNVINNFRAGTYEVLVTGIVQIDTAPVTPGYTMRLEVNGVPPPTTWTNEHYIQACPTGPVPSGEHWLTTVSLLTHLDLGPSSTLRVQHYAIGSPPAFCVARVVVRQLA